MYNIYFEKREMTLNSLLLTEEFSFKRKITLLSKMNVKKKQHNLKII
jgi:hypothetical protein